jgi:U11/U12 small nuclear ribonucleoprotein 25 kDa protein
MFLFFLRQLHFAQHLSIDYNPPKSFSKNHKAASHRRYPILQCPGNAFFSVCPHNFNVYVKFLLLKTANTGSDILLYRPMTSIDDLSFRPRTLLNDLNEEVCEKFADMRRSSTSVLEEGLSVYQHNEQCIEESCKKGGFFRGWLAYAGLRSNRTHAEDTVPLSCKKKNTRPKLGKWLSSKRSKAQCNLR